MVCKDSKGQALEVIVSGYGDDVQIEEATYLDGTHVSDEEVEYVYNTYAEEIAETAFQNAVGRAEAAYEGER